MHLWLVLRLRGQPHRCPASPVDPRPTNELSRPSSAGRAVSGRRDAARTSCSSRLAVIVVVALGAPGWSQGPDGPPDPHAARSQSAARNGPFSGSLPCCRSARRRPRHSSSSCFRCWSSSALFLVPLVSNRGKRAPSRRPVAVLAVIVIYTLCAALTYQGVTAPWSPEMTAWSGDPIPTTWSSKCRRSIARAARVSDTRTAATATPWKGVGGRRGPDLDDRRHTTDPRSVDRSDQQWHARRRQHARLRQTDEAGRNDGRWSTSVGPSAAGGANRRTEPARRGHAH